jgi:hypothetical protein
LESPAPDFGFLQHKGPPCIRVVKYPRLTQSVKKSLQETRMTQQIGTELLYQSGFGNEFATEALPGALPAHRNSPQRVAYGLYAEQISGTAFTAPRAHNRRSWLYRIRPAAMHGPFAQVDSGRIVANFAGVAPPPDQMRWSPLPMPDAPTDFIDGWVTMAGNGSPESMSGCAIHLYAANRPMRDRFFYSADGELLIVPQQGRLEIATELGTIDLEPQQIAVPARHPLPGTPARWRGARLYLRKFRRPPAPAGPGADRLERPGESARFPHPCRPLRRPRRRFPAGGEILRQAVGGQHRPLATGRRRLARQLRPL